MTKSVFRILLILFLFSLAANVSNALDAKTYNASFNIVGSKAVADVDIIKKK